jgi:hypothetical protein
VKKTFLFLLAAAWGCGGGSTTHNQNPNCQPGTGSALNATCDPGFSETSPPKPGVVYVTFSGEALGVNGLPFPQQNPDDPFFVDGWSVSFDEILVVLGNFRLSPGATASADQKTISAPVATMPGPYVVDMHNPNGFTGKGGAPERAGGIFQWSTDDSGKSFDTNTRYAFSYDVKKAVYPATQVNLTSAQFADYNLMVTNGWSKLYRGTATYTGVDPATMPFSAGIQARFKAMPSTVHFLLGWNDAGSHLDCINPDFGSNEDLANRGIQPTSSGPVIAQATLHTDHLFWDILAEHDNVQLRFDTVAAWATAANANAATPIDLRTLANKPLALTFADGTPMPDRGQFENTSYQCGGTRPCAQVTMNLNGVPADRVPGLGNFMAFSAQSQMHLNSDGLCYDVGQHAADPYFTPGL